MRSILFAPANHPRHSIKVFASGADAGILDLEDAVAATEKSGARDMAVAALATPRSCRAYVRINALDTPYAYGDLQAVVGAGLDGIILPMARKAQDVACADWLISQLERERGLDVGRIELMPIIETALGVQNVELIARQSTRVRRLAFGAGDLVNDLAMEWTAGELELLYARTRLSIASRAAGLAPPIDTAHVDIQDLDGLRAAARRARECGFGGKFCIYPSQVSVVNAVFSPGTAEVERARRIVDAFETAERHGSAAIRVDGAFVDYPIVDRARRVLENHRLAAGLDARADASR